MRKIFITFTIAGALALAVASPAVADTVATTDVVVTTAVDLTVENFGGTYTSLVPAGAVSFPLSVPLPAADDFFASAFSVPAAAAGCTRVVNSASFAFDVVTTSDSTIQTVVTVDPVGTLPLDTTFAYEGDGTITDDYGSGGEITVPAAPSAGGVATLTYATPVAPEDTLLAIGIPGKSVDATWTFSNISFNVTDTCVVPAVVAPALADTGVDASVAALAGASLLGAGMAVVMFASRRRWHRINPEVPACFVKRPLL